MKQPKKTELNRYRISRIRIGCGIGAVLLIASAAFSEKETAAGTNTAKPKTMQKALRDPFWPVGYYPEGWGMSVAEKKKSDQVEKQRQTVSSKGWEQAMKKIVINGICSSSEDKEFMAIINNKIKSVGEMIVIDTGNGKFFWRVVKVQPPRSVKLLRVKAEALGSVSVNVD